MPTYRVSTPTVWTLEHTFEEYRDYMHYVPDANGYGVRMCLTLDTAARTAWIHSTVDDINGEEYGCADLTLPWATACAMVSYSEEPA